MVNDTFKELKNGLKETKNLLQALKKENLSENERRILKEKLEEDPKNEELSPKELELKIKKLLKEIK